MTITAIASLNYILSPNPRHNSDYNIVTPTLTPTLALSTRLRLEITHPRPNPCLYHYQKDGCSRWIWIPTMDASNRPYLIQTVLASNSNNVGLLGALCVSRYFWESRRLRCVPSARFRPESTNSHENVAKHLFLVCPAGSGRGRHRS